jgi:hypothetical protein
LLRDKEKESLEKSELEYRTAKDLEAAAKVKKNQAWEDANVAHKEHKSKEKAESEAQKKLAVQEQLMREAARHEENARNLLAVAERERLKELERQQEIAKQRREAAELVRIVFNAVVCLCGISSMYSQRRLSA